MAALTVHEITLAGDGKAYVAAAAAGDTVTNDGRTFLHCKNSNAATRNVVVDSVALCSQGFDHDNSVALAATTGDEMIGPFPVSRFGSTLAITYTPAETGVTIAALRLPA